MMFIHLVGKFGGKVWLRHIWFHCRTVVQVAVFGGKVVWESCVGKLCGKVVWESCNVMWVMIKCVFDYMMR